MGPATEPVVIRQLEKPNKVLVLSGMAGPRGRATIGGVRQRREITRHSGNRQGHAHLHGAEELPTDLQVVWEDRHLATGAVTATEGGKTRRITTARELLAFARGMVADEVLVSVLAFGFEPVGVFAELESALVGGRGERWECDLEFEWVAPGRRRRTRPGQLVAVPTAGAMTATLRGLLDRALGAITLPATVITKQLDGMSGALAHLGEAIADVEAVPTAYGRTEGAALDLGARADALWRAERGASAVVQAVPAASGATDPITMLVSRHFGGRVDAGMRTVHGSAGVSRRQVAEPRRSYYTATEGEDLRLIAWELYGDVDAWVVIATLNGLRGSVLSGGELLRLPTAEELRRR